MNGYVASIKSALRGHVPATFLPDGDGPELLGHYMAFPLLDDASRVMRELIAYRPGPVSTPHLVNALTCWKEDGGSLYIDNDIHRCVRQIRARIRPEWAVIKRQGRGYSLERVQ